MHPKLLAAILSGRGFVSSGTPGYWTHATGAGTGTNNWTGGEESIPTSTSVDFYVEWESDNVAADLRFYAYGTNVTTTGNAPSTRTWVGPLNMTTGTSGGRAVAAINDTGNKIIYDIACVPNGQARDGATQYVPRADDPWVEGDFEGTDGWTWNAGT